MSLHITWTDYHLQGYWIAGRHYFASIHVEKSKTKKQQQQQQQKQKQSFANILQIGALWN